MELLRHTHLQQQQILWIYTGRRNGTVNLPYWRWSGVRASFWGCQSCSLSPFILFDVWREIRLCIDMVQHLTMQTPQWIFSLMLSQTNQGSNTRWTTTQPDTPQMFKTSPISLCDFRVSCLFLHFERTPYFDRLWFFFHSSTSHKINPTNLALHSWRAIHKVRDVFDILEDPWSPAWTYHTWRGTT